MNWNIMGDNRERMVFTIPVGNLSRKEAEEEIEKFMKGYKEYEYGDYWFPVPVKDENKNNIEIDNGKK